ncbi:hypothetical protein [Brevibacillus centrosporus]|uniref:hypothetical protein n=1 Tax=Brevibacillus centrosporus TaxID=54910 RepID=UPI002E214820|nr:hypothetical protein [Brevibacillus centrosporus]
MAQTGKKADVEFLIAGDDNVTQILKGIVGELQGVQNKTRQTGREVNNSFDQMSDSARRAGDGVQTVGDRIRNISQGVSGLKKLNDELDQTEDKARDAGREMERGFREGGRAADQASNRVSLLKQKVVEVTREMRGMFDALNQGTAGFQSFVGDQVRRGAYVGGLAVTGFAASSVNKTVNQEYEFSKLGSVLKSSYYENGVLNETAFNKDFAQLQQYIKQQGLRKDRETDTMGIIGMATELAKNNMNLNQVMEALPVVADFTQANSGKGGLESDEAAKYLANKAEALKLPYTQETFEQLADQFTKTVDMSSLDPRDLRYAEKYTDFGNAIGGVDYAISQAMQVLLSKISVEGETAGTALRTLFIESSNMAISDNARSNVSSEKVGQMIDSIIKDVNSVNAAVDADKNVVAGQKGNEKILRKAAIMNKYMSQLTSDQQLEVGSLLFGKEAASVTTIFANDGYKDLLSTIDAIRGSGGITKRYADDRSNTSKGDLVALGKAINEIQDKVGRSLQPTLDATTNQMIQLATEGKFSFDEISKGIEQSADLLAKELNPEIADTFRQLTELAISGFEVGVSLTPLATGAGKALLKLLNGDITGAANEVVLALDATDLRIEKLPGELQGLANAAKNAAIFLAAVAAVDKGITLAENGKKIWDAGRKIGETISGRKPGGSVLGDFDSKTIKANVVNVYGDTINGGKGSGVPGAGGKAAGAGGAAGSAGRTAGRAVAAEVATTTAGAAVALGLAGGVAYVVGDAVEDVTGIKQEKRYNDAAGASLWFNQSHYGTFYGDSPGDSAQYRKEMKTVGDMIAGYRNRVSYETLNQISKELWAEAEKNMKEGSNHIFGDNQEDVAAYVDRRINKARNISDYDDARQEKKLRREMMPGWEEQDKLRGYYSGMPATGMWPTPEPSSKDRAQYIRELESDPFASGSYKRKMIDEMTQRPSAQTPAAATLIPTLMAELNKLQQKPIEVHSDNNLRVVVEDNRAVQVQMESVSSYANRTYNNRTQTPMQAVKMKQLE